MLILTAKSIIEDFAIGVIEGIKDNIRNKQVTPFGAVHSSGHAEDSLFYRITDNGLIIGSSWAYITVLEDGRKPGKFAPPEVIEGWIEDKPLPVQSNSDFKQALTKQSLAFLINRSLKEKGSLIYRQGGHSGILSEFTSQEYVHEHLTLPLKEAAIKYITGILFKAA
jgi:hypothetical protein